MQDKIEILAPAGNADCAFEAISNGADAIYVGLKNFNARMTAGNFSTEELANLTQFAHQNGARVYLALNILLTDIELQNLCKILPQIVQTNVDAIIFADFGLFSIIKKNYPQFPLHLSTQGGVFDQNGAKFAKSQQIDRVIVARETQKEQLQKISKVLECEVFCSGAVCTGFSGHCLFSAVLSAKSGNRGRCLSPCRLYYTSSCKGKKLASGYLLSSKDLFCAESVKTLQNLGVCSLKIEGRLRKPQYVAQMVNLFSGVANGKVLQTIPDKNNFHKGLFFCRNKIINSKKQGHMDVQTELVKKQKITAVNVKKQEFLDKLAQNVPLCKDSLQLEIPKNTYVQKVISIANFSSFNRYCENFDNLVFSPKDYLKAEKELEKFLASGKEIYINIPSFLLDDDEKCIQKLLDFDKNIGIFANNLSAVWLAKEQNRKCIISEKLNVFNAKSLQFFSNFADKIILSAELNEARIKYLAKQNANFFDVKVSKNDLIELNHCPMQENFGGNCAKCNYVENIIYQNTAKQNFVLMRKKAQRCHFRLVSSIISIKGDNDRKQHYFNFENFSQRELDDYFADNLVGTNRGFESRTV